MTATETARRSDSLYYDGLKRRELCDMVANRESELEEAKAENARLQEVVADGEMHAREILAENAKLQELCLEMLENLMPEICAKAYWCSVRDWHTCNDAACGNYTFVILAQELGVGVDDAS